MIAYAGSTTVALEPFPFHVIDLDHNRRASIACDLYALSLHPEIYEDVEELIKRFPTDGAILIADEGATDPSSIDIYRAQNGYLPMACFSAAPSPQGVVKAMLSRAVDYLQWPFSSDALEAAVTRLQFDGSQQAKLERRKAEARQLVDALTRRERDVLEGVLSSESNKENARRLRISPRTVEIHRCHMMARLGAHSVSDAVRIGLYAGLGETE